MENDYFMKSTLNPRAWHMRYVFGALCKHAIDAKLIDCYIDKKKKKKKRFKKELIDHCVR